MYDYATFSMHAHTSQPAYNQVYLRVKKFGRERINLSEVLPIGLVMEKEHSPGPKINFETGIAEYSERLNTYNSWTGKIEKHRLAYSGLLYTGEGDRCVCQYCDGKLYNWEPEDDPYTEHKKHFPNCPFILQLDHDHMKPSVTEYRDLTTRLASFQKSTLSHTPSHLAAAGFYYVGYADRVKCFHCGMVFYDWNKDDEPFKVHKLWSPACTFIQGLTDFEKLGVNLLKNNAASISVVEKIITCTKDTSEQTQNIAEINQQSDLFQELLTTFDADTIIREMTAMIIQTGRNFRDVKEYVAFKKDREERLDQKLRHPNPTGANLKAENDAMKKGKQCQNCKKRDTTIVFLTCGHLVCCDICSPAMTYCLICGELVKGTVKIYRA